MHSQVAKFRVLGQSCRGPRQLHPRSRHLYQRKNDVAMVWIRSRNLWRGKEDRSPAHPYSMEANARRTIYARETSSLANQIHWWYLTRSLRQECRSRPRPLRGVEKVLPGASNMPKEPYAQYRLRRFVHWRAANTHWKCLWRNRRQSLRGL